MDASCHGCTSNRPQGQPSVVVVVVVVVVMQHGEAHARTYLLVLEWAISFVEELGIHKLSSLEIQKH
jgi:hypothetical protein